MSSRNKELEILLNSIGTVDVEVDGRISQYIYSYLPAVTLKDALIVCDEGKHMRHRVSRDYTWRINLQDYHNIRQSLMRIFRLFASFKWKAHSKCLFSSDGISTVLVKGEHVTSFPLVQVVSQLTPRRCQSLQPLQRHISLPLLI